VNPLKPSAMIAIRKINMFCVLYRWDNISNSSLEFGYTDLIQVFREPINRVTET